MLFIISMTKIEYVVCVNVFTEFILIITFSPPLRYGLCAATSYMWFAKFIKKI